MRKLVNFRNVAILLVGTLFLVSCDKSDSDLNPEQILEPGKDGILVTDKPEFSMSFDGDLSLEEVKNQYNAAYSEFKSKNNITGRTQEQGDIKLSLWVKTGTRSNGTCLNSELWWEVRVNNQKLYGLMSNSIMASSPGWHGMTVIINPAVGSFASISDGALWLSGNDDWHITGYMAQITAEGGIGASSFSQSTNKVLLSPDAWARWATPLNIGVGQVDVFPDE